MASFHVFISGHDTCFRELHVRSRVVFLYPLLSWSSGIAAFSESSFISSALDGSLQTFSLDPLVASGHVTPGPVAMATHDKGSKGMHVQGVAVSEMGVYAAVSVK